MRKLTFRKRVTRNRAQEGSPTVDTEKEGAQSVLSASLRTMQPLCKVLRGHLDHITEETETAATVLVEHMLGIDGAATELAGAVSALSADAEHRAAAAHKETEMYLTEHDATTADLLQRTEAVRTLADDLNALGDLATSVTKMAHTTRMLSLNATIEASRVGDAGAGFQVIASEVRELARASGDAAEQITISVANLTQRVREIADALASSSLSRTGDRLTAVSDGLDELGATVRSAEAQAHQLSALTTDVLGAVQFQDITRQMCEHAQRGLDMVGRYGEASSAWLDGDETAENIRALGGSLDALYAGYVMESQRATHTDLAPKAAENIGSAIELF